MRDWEEYMENYKFYPDLPFLIFLSSFQSTIGTQVWAPKGARYRKGRGRPKKKAVKSSGSYKQWVPESFENLVK